MSGVQGPERHTLLSVERNSMDLQLSGRTAVVTDAPKGIGPATNRTLLDKGARVVAVSRQPTAQLDALASIDCSTLNFEFAR